MPRSSAEAIERNRKRQQVRDRKRRADERAERMARGCLGCMGAHRTPCPFRTDPRRLVEAMGRAGVKSTALAKATGLESWRVVQEVIAGRLSIARAGGSLLAWVESVEAGA